MINKINNILLLDSFRSCIERRSTDFLSKRDLSVSSLFQDKTPFRLFSGGPKKFEDDESALQGVTRTFGICSSMLIYNVACEAIFTQGIPVEKVASVGLFLFHGGRALTLLNGVALTFSARVLTNSKA